MPWISQETNALFFSFLKKKKQNASFNTLETITVLNYNILKLKFCLVFNFFILKDILFLQCTLKKKNQESQNCM